MKKKYAVKIAISILVIVFLYMLYSMFSTNFEKTYKKISIETLSGRYIIKVENGKKQGPVTFLLDGKIIKTSKERPYYLVLDTSGLRDGIHELTIKGGFLANKSKTWLFNVNNHGLNIKMRKFPFPYRAMLAINSDIDGCTLAKFEEIHRFLNTTEITKYGRGLGLDIADSFWMFVAHNGKGKIDAKGSPWIDEMSYWYGLDFNKLHDAKAIKKYYKAGWIDSMHTYGDFTRINEKDVVFKREYAEKAIKELEKQGIRVEVWMDHGNKANVQNFVMSTSDAFYSYQKGDDPHSPYYHTDLLIPYGIKFGWGPSSDQFGYDSMIFPRILRDGQGIWVYPRYTYAEVNGKILWLWNPKMLAKQLSESHLRSIIENNQYSIVGQHFGINADNYLFNADAIKALNNLKREYEKGNILVARTSRLLNYNLVQKFLEYSITKNKDGYVVINILKVNDPLLGAYVPKIDDIRGVTFYVDNPQKTIIELDSRNVPDTDISRNGTDYIGKKSIGIKWFQRDTTDYTKIG